MDKACLDVSEMWSSRPPLFSYLGFSHVHGASRSKDSSYLCLVFRRTMAGVDTVDHV